MEYRPINNGPHEAPKTFKEAMQFSPITPLVPSQAVTELVEKPEAQGSIGTLAECIPVSQRKISRQLMARLNDTKTDDASHFAFVNKHIDYVCQRAGNLDLSQIEFIEGYVVNSNEPDIPFDPQAFKLSPFALTTFATANIIVNENLNISNQLKEKKVVIKQEVPVESPSKVAVSSYQAQLNQARDILAGIRVPTPPVAIKQEPLDDRSSEPLVPIPIEAPIISPLKKIQDKRQKLRNEFTELIDNIFFTDEDIQNDTLGKIDKNIWYPPFGDNDNHCLAEYTLITVDDALRRAILCDWFVDYDIDSLFRLQKICQRSLNAYDTLPWAKRLAGDTSIPESEYILVAANAVRASKIIIRILLSNRSEKRLFSEDLILLIIDVFSSIIETCFIPLIHIPMTEIPESIVEHRQLSIDLLHSLDKAIDLYASFISTGELGETHITRLEFLSTKVIFAENVQREKDSLLGIANFESLRVSIMEVLCRIFRSYPLQRSFILNEILTSLEKLPVRRLTARQFKLSRQVNIQLVSALLMRLIHTCGSVEFDFPNPEYAQFQTTKLADVLRSDFGDKCHKAMLEAATRVSEIVNFLISRAIRSSKSSIDATPYRALLDLFSEDLLNVLTFPEWVAADLMLKILVTTMIKLAADEKQPTGVVTLALDLMGTIGSKLMEIQNMDSSSTSTKGLALSQLDEATAIVFLQLRNMKKDEPSLASSSDYFFTQYGSMLYEIYKTAKPEDKLVLGKMMDKLLLAGFENNSSDAINPTQIFVSHDELNEASVVAYRQVLLTRTLFKYQETIMGTTLRALEQSRIQVRSKALRTLAMLLAQDHSILSLPNVQHSLAARLVDSSASVRDAAVDIVGKYIILRPEVAPSYYMILCERSNDAGMAVRKRVIKILKDLYAATTDIVIRTEIADRLLRRLGDEEDTVVELIMAVLQELWFDFANEDSDGVRSFVDNLTLERQVAAQSAVLSEVAFNRGDKTNSLLLDFFDILFHGKIAKATPEVRSAATLFVKYLVDKVVNTDIDTGDTQKYICLISLFAESNGALMTQDQLISLHSFIITENTDDRDLSCYYTLKTFDSALAEVGVLSDGFTTDLQSSLLKKLSRFNSRELTAAVPSLWQISVMKKDTLKVATAAVQCLTMLKPYSSAAERGVLKSAPDSKLIRVLHLLGNIGRFCELDEHANLFMRSQANRRSPRSVSELIGQRLLVFCQPGVNIVTRKISLRNMMNLGITHPRLFVTQPVIDLFDAIFKDKDRANRDLKETVLRMTIQFLEYEEKTANKLAVNRGNKYEKVDIEVLHGNGLKFANDGVCTSLVQKYLPFYLDFCLGSEDEFAVVAVVLLERIAKQGFGNPRTFIGTVIALESSSRRAISSMAVEIHTKLHEKHGSLIEGCYVEGVKLAAAYRAKLSRNLIMEIGNLSNFYCVIKDSRPSKKKFFMSLRKTMDFDPLRDPIDTLKSHLTYMIFLARALSSLEFATNEDVYFVIYGLDRVIAGSGVALLHAVERFREDIEDEAEEDVHLAEADSEVDNAAWRDYAVGSTIININWQLRAYLKRAYRLNEVKCRAFDPSRVMKDNKPAVRGSTYSYMGLMLNDPKVVDIRYKFDDKIVNRNISVKLVETMSNETSDLDGDDFDTERVIKVIDEKPADVAEIDRSESESESESKSESDSDSDYDPGVKRQANGSEPLTKRNRIV